MTSKQVIAVINSKGGVGKTTTAVMLAQALVKYGSVELWDADSQASASEWWERAEERGDLPFKYAVANRRTLTKGSSCDYLVIDTPPGDAGIMDAAIDAATFVLIPTSATAIDMDRVWETLDATRGKTRAVLLTQARKGTKSLEAVIKLLDAEEVPRFETVIYRREAIAQAFGHMTPDDLNGYAEVAAEIKEVIDNA